VVKVLSFVDEGLGHTSYLVDLGDGTALVVDPARLPSAQRAAAAERKLRIAWTADTHSHADYVSGSPELAADGATFLAPAEGRLALTHRGTHDGERIVMGRCMFEAVATPGHTPDHLSYLLRDEHDKPLVLFSGGALMVGALGRTDLLGSRQAEPLARRLFRAMRDRVLTLPDDVAVYPTHGAGSFCSAPSTGERSTTIGKERATNPLLQILDEDEFVAALLGGLGSFPDYFGRLPEVNRLGPRIYPEAPVLKRLSLEAFRQAVDAGAQVVDTRPLVEFAAAHLHGALAIELRPVFATWLGWLVDPQRPVVFVVGDDQDRAEIVRQALTVGVEDLAGELDGAMTAWLSAGLPTASLEIVDSEHLRGPVLDVRQHSEFAAGHLPGAHNVELADLRRDVAVPNEPITVMCGHGERAMTGASLLERTGRAHIAVLAGGPNDWSAATGKPLVKSV
jgi:hydroxyacylglutathione hydrolase